MSLIENVAFPNNYGPFTVSVMAR